MRRGLPKSIIKKYGVTKKAWQVFRGKRRRKSRSTRRARPKRKSRRVKRTAKGKRRVSRRSLAIGLVSAGMIGHDILLYQGASGQPLYEMSAGNWGKAVSAILSNASQNAVPLAAKLITLQFAKRAVGNVKIIKLGRVTVNAL